MFKGQDDPATLGAYRVRGILGRGGMGIVYWGEHADTGQEVAIKTVEAVSAHEIASIRREIHALSRVRHPGIVRILAQGVHGGRPWYAMELLRSRTLRGYLDGKQPGDSIRPGDLAFECVLLLRLAETLSYLHGAGFVHRDLKPENIFVCPDGAPVLVDFGITERFGGASGRDALDIGGLRTGSTLYMSPEQIRGDVVDARSDLYALGCILYECLTGHPPFDAPTAREVLIEHLTQIPLPPSARVSGVPPRIDRLAMKLLEKRPQDRIGYAEDVIASLSAFAPARPKALPDIVPYLYRPSFLGRHDVLWELQGHLRAAGAGHGRLVLVGGASGVGKTRLMTELARLASRGPCTVITGECVSLGIHGASAGPLHPFRSLLLAIADHCHRNGPAASKRILGDRASVLAAYEPALAGFATDGVEPASDLAAPAAQKRVLASLTEALLALAQEKPLLLIIDDLQWADELSLLLLRALAETPLEGRRLLAVGTYRTDEVCAELGAVIDAAGVDHIELSGLDPASMRQMARDMLALSDAPRGFLDFATRASDGNPFFLAAYLRAAIAEGLISREPGGAFRVTAQAGIWESARAPLPLPASLAGLIERQLKGLDAAARAILRVSAVIGREVTEEVLCRAAHISEQALMDALGSLRRAHVFEDEGGRLRFTHDKLREVVYDEIPQEERTALHARVGRAIEETYPDEQREDHVEALAFHYTRSGHLEEAARYAEAAAAKAARAYALDDARRRYGEALSLLARLGDDPGVLRRRVDVTLRWAEACLYEPEPGQLEVLATARGIALQIGDAKGALRCDYWTSWIEYALGEHERAIEVLGRALEEASALGERRLLPQFVLNLGQNYAAMTAYDEALEHIHRGLAMAAGPVGRSRKSGKAYGLGYLGLIHGDRGEFVEAYQHIQSALDLSTELGRRSLESSVLVQRAMVESFQGAFEACATTARRARRLAESLGAPYVGAMSKTAEGLSLFSLGQHEEGLALLQEALRWHDTTGTRLCVSWSYGALAEALACAGRAEEAAAQARAALARAEKGDRIGMVMAHRALALVSARNDPAAARAHLEEAFAAARGKRSPREEALTRLCAARVHQIQGALSQARAEAQAALEALSAMGMSHFADEARSFGARLG
ncbi:serine/threonine-protein kinase PknK [Polyangium aurulentum]|uniref:serine/threonine-protein kinase n=1 Tax=Polyangium aurulentum TaxID=2567896 RepID=UPI00146F65F8|nr:serine/threonine-protein kinase [Polyangium aurulentum]UQA62571.1 protein kinase [Polyangium aurulentum]